MISVGHLETGFSCKSSWLGACNNGGKQVSGHRRRILGPSSMLQSLQYNLSHFLQVITLSSGDVPAPAEVGTEMR